MSLEWLKVAKATPDKPEILEIAEIHSIDHDAAFGKVFRVWSYFDEHTVDGYAPSATKVMLDRITGVTNFANSMIKVGWLIEENGFLCVANFEKHNGTTAKKRAQSASRMAKSRAKQGDQESYANSATDTQQKRHQEKEKEKEVTKKKPRAKAKKIETEIGDFALSEKDRENALRYWQQKGISLNVDDQFFKFQNHHIKKANKFVDWSACWRTWYSSEYTINEGLRNAASNQPVRQIGGARLSAVDEQQAAINAAREQLSR